MNATLRDLLGGALPPALYTLRSRTQPATLAAALAGRGWRCFTLDGAAIDSKAAFLSASAAAMQFPAYFGRNWDAFEECVNDLSWVPAAGHVLLYDHAAHFARAQPAEWAIARSILADAAARSAGAGTPFYVLLRGARAR